MESTIPITVRNAVVRTAQVEVKTLSISGKQVTLAVFRQLKEETLLDPSTGQLAGVVWGTVNYFWGTCRNDHLHAVWQKGDELRRSCVYKSRWSTRTEELKRAVDHETVRNRVLAALILFDILTDAPSLRIIPGPSDYTQAGRFEIGVGDPTWSGDLDGVFKEIEGTWDTARTIVAVWRYRHPVGPPPEKTVYDPRIKDYRPETPEETRTRIDAEWDHWTHVLQKSWTTVIEGTPIGSERDRPTICRIVDRLTREAKEQRDESVRIDLLHESNYQVVEQAPQLFIAV